MRALVVLLLFAGLAGCTANEGGTDAGPDITHVHGLAYDPVGSLYVATHHGLAKGTPSWTWSYVGDERHDFMGFTQDTERPGVFYSSGHPSDARAFGGVHLGLRRSLDGGETWQQQSLRGEVDFHALTSLPGSEGWLAGYWQGALKVSRDGGTTWQDHVAPPATVFALTAAEGRLFAGTSSGIFQTADMADFADWTLLPSEGLTGAVSSLTTTRDGQTLFASTMDGRSGSAYRSVDGGVSWTSLGPEALRATAAPVIFAIDPSDATHVFASTAFGHILESKDQGESWTTIRAP